MLIKYLIDNILDLLFGRVLTKTPQNAEKLTLVDGPVRIAIVKSKCLFVFFK